MNNSKLTMICKKHISQFKKDKGHGSFAQLSKLTGVEASTIRGIISNRNKNATGVTIEKILKHFENPLYLELNKQAANDDINTPDAG